MASIVSGLDSHTPLRVGENLHAERDYSNELSEKVVQFFFQLVRSEDHSKLEAIQRDILLSIKGDLEKNYDTLDMMYKLIGQTRDIISGKGEQKLAFMQIWGFYDTGYEALTYSAIKHFVQRVNDEHPYGSWKDVKYFLQVSSRDYEYADRPRSYIGFRTVHDYLGGDLSANAMTNTNTKRRNNKRSSIK